MKRKKAERYLRIVNPKIVYLCSAAGVQIGDRLDLYERGRVIALVGSRAGVFHAGAKSKQCSGRNISSEELVTYLMQKYGVEIGSRLPIWGSEEEPVVYTGLGLSPAEAEYRLDEQFAPVVLAYRPRFGNHVYVEDNCLSFSAMVRDVLPRRLALYDGEDTLALIGDPEGPYIMEDRGGSKKDAIYCGQLAAYCKARFGFSGRSLLFHAVILENGVAFSDREEALPVPGRPYEPVRIDFDLAQDLFITLHRCHRVIYISSRAAKQLGTQAGIYEAEGFLALKHERRGSYAAIKSQRYLQAGGLFAEIKSRYPGSKRLYLHPHGDLLALVRNAEDTKRLPTPERFRRLALPLRQGRAPVGNAERCPNDNTLPRSGNTLPGVLMDERRREKAQADKDAGRAGWC